MAKKTLASVRAGISYQDLIAAESLLAMIDSPEPPTAVTLEDRRGGKFDDVAEWYPTRTIWKQVKWSEHPASEPFTLNGMATPAPNRKTSLVAGFAASYGKLKGVGGDLEFHLISNRTVDPELQAYLEGVPPRFKTQLTQGRLASWTQHGGTKLTCRHKTSTTCYAHSACALAPASDPRVMSFINVGRVVRSCNSPTCPAQILDRWTDCPDRHGRMTAGADLDNVNVRSFESIFECRFQFLHCAKPLTVISLAWLVGPLLSPTHERLVPGVENDGKSLPSSQPPLIVIKFESMIPPRSKPCS